MGTNIGSIQNAYTGFMKGNYTMLDNLNLGFSGTKEGMQQLLTYANSLDGSIDPTDMGLTNVIDAIGKVQEAMGIAGTTADEAMGTIEGSSRMTQSAWQNVITAIGGGGDLEKAFENLQYAIFGDGSTDDEGEQKGFFGQIIPRFKKIFENIAEFVGKAAPIITEKLPQLIEDLTPAFESLVESLGMIFETLAPVFEKVLGIVAPQIASAVLTLGGQIVKSLIEGIGDLGPVGKAITVGLGLIFGKGAISGIVGFVKTLATIGPTLGIVGAAIAAVVLIWENWDTIVAVAKDLWGKFTEFMPKAIEGAANAIKTAWSTFTGWLSEGFDSIVTGVKTFGSNIVEKLNTILSKVTTFAKNVVDGIKNAITTAVDTVKTLWNNFTGWISKGFTNITTGITTFGSNIANGLKTILKNVSTFAENFVSGIWNAAKTAVTNATTTLSDAVQNFWDIGKNWISGLWNGFVERWNEVKDKLSDWGSNVTGFVKKIFGISSPSKVFMEIGGYLSEGLAVGIEKSADKAYSALEAVGDSLASKGEQIFTVVSDAIDSTVDQGLGAYDSSYDYGVAANDSSQARLNNVSSALDSAYMEQAAIKDMIEKSQISSSEGQSKLDVLTAQISNLTKQLQSSADSQQPVTFTNVLELDGSVVAKKTYQYNQRETSLHGASLVTA